MEAFILRHYNPKRIVILETNAFNYTLKSILSQKNNNNNLYFVAFYSKNMLLTKYNYNIYNKKLLTIIRYLKI